MNGWKCDRVRLSGLIVLMALAQARSAPAQQLPAQPRDFVVDLAGVIDRGTFQRLNGFLVELEQKTGTQMIVLTVNTTGGVPIEDFALRTAEKWKLGRKGQDNGALIVVAVKDHKSRVEVGYGLEPMLPDSVCGRVVREVFAPRFQKGQFAQGIYEGTLVLANRVAQAASVQITAMPARALPQSTHGGKSSGLGGVLIFVVILLVLSSLFGRSAHLYRNRRYTSGLWLWLLLGGLGGGGHGGRNWGSWGGGWGGGGGGGGGFGGGSFGGGGGGSFGGGGASGGW